MNSALGLAFMLIPSLLFLAWMIQLSAKKFLKKNKCKTSLDFKIYMNAFIMAVFLLMIEFILRMLFKTNEFAINLLVGIAMIGIYFRYYKIKTWYKPVIIVIGIMVAMTIFTVIWSLLGMVLIG